MNEYVHKWRATFKEGWECAECEHKKTIVMTPEGYPHDEGLPPPIPQRMCMAGNAFACPVVQESMENYNEV